MNVGVVAKSWTKDAIHVVSLFSLIFEFLHQMLSHKYLLCVQFEGVQPFVIYFVCEIHGNMEGQHHIIT